MRSIRSSLWLVLFLGATLGLAGCPKASGGLPPATAPGGITVTGPVGFSPMGPLTYGRAWGAAQQATSYRVSVAATATNGAWSGLPTQAPVLTGTSFSFTVSAVPWDTVTFTATVESVDRIGPTGKTVSTTWKAVHRAGAPGPIVVDSSKAIGVLVKPDSSLLFLGATRVTCAFLQFASGAVSEFTGDRASCDTLYTRTVPAAARGLVTAFQQHLTDSVAASCVTWSTTNPLALGLMPKAPCSAAVVITGLALTIQARPDRTLFRYVRWEEDRRPIISVTPDGRFTCLRQGTWEGELTGRDLATGVSGTVHKKRV